jgi:hypothetical protein
VISTLEGRKGGRNLERQGKQQHELKGSNKKRASPYPYKGDEIRAVSSTPEKAGSQK